MYDLIGCPSDFTVDIHIQWCSGKFSLVGTRAWPYGHIPCCYRGGGGGGVPG